MGKGGGSKHSNQHKFQASYEEKRRHRGKGQTQGHGGLQWGTQEEREGADARGDYDLCRMCLTSPKDPLMCPKGNVYCKGCIYAFLLKGKQDYKTKMEAFEKQEQEDLEKVGGESATKELKMIEEFKNVENAVVSVNTTSEKKRKIETEDAPIITNPNGYKKFKTPDGKDVIVIDKEFVHNYHHGKLDKEEMAKKKPFLGAFWVPSLIPDAVVAKLKKPTTDILDPMGYKLKRKELTEIKYTLNPDFKQGESSSDEKYMCPVSRKTLTNASKIFLLKPTGDVLSSEAINIILSDGVYKECKIKKKHVVAFANNGTGFAAGGAKLVKKYTQALLC